jgi:hypothetical protein
LIERARDKTECWKLDPPLFNLSLEESEKTRFVSLCDRSIERVRGRRY